MKGFVGGEPLGNAYDLAPERLELQLDGLILYPALAVKDSGRRRDRNHVAHRPSSERSIGASLSCSGRSAPNPSRRASKGQTSDAEATRRPSLWAFKLSLRR